MIIASKIGFQEANREMTHAETNSHPSAARLIQSELYRQLVSVRRDLHKHPELSWQEHRTANRVCQFLDGLGIGLLILSSGLTPPFSSMRCPPIKPERSA